MNKDNPDTFSMGDQSEWEVTQMDDMFLPSVQVVVRWSDVETAVARGAIVPSQAHGLWAVWAAPGSPMRRIGVAIEQAYQPTQPEDTEPADLPPPREGGMKSVIMLLIGAATGAALTFVLKG